MARSPGQFSPPGPVTGAIILIAVIVMGVMAYERYKEFKNTFSMDGVTKIPRVFKGELLGSLPSPTQPAISEPVKKIIKPKLKKKKKMRKVVVRRIPSIIPGRKPMPHNYWGPCIKCHLIEGGAPAGSQPITPLGKVYVKASTLKKVGPPILPDSTRHHPEAGRCIKCHDIIISVVAETPTPAQGNAQSAGRGATASRPAGTTAQPAR